MANPFNLARRFMTFRKELVLLWSAFLAPETPLHLKGLMLLVPLYLLSPIDLVPDFIPILGWLDDLMIVPLLVSWITSMLPKAQQATGDKPRAGGAGKVIEGTARRR
jgi:uncharacterized membrane protein YkvA (DUF1232 family)